MTRPSDVPRPSPDPAAHWHRFGVLHRHPDWHGHCGNLSGEHRCHRCHRWHFHLPFRHRHTETGR